MSNDALFMAANTIVLPGWFLLVFAPRWQYTRHIIFICIVLPLAVLYAWLFGANFSAVMSGGDGMTLTGISAGFQNPTLMLIGWVHYLAFDIMTGMWEVRDAHASGVPHLLVIPCLVATFLAGPVGLLLYWIFRTIRTKRVLEA